MKKRNIAAIPTTYGGTEFRSRLEARWAILFRLLGVHYQYEPAKYRVTTRIAYIPDFWLPQQECFVEVKPASPSVRESEKAFWLARLTGKPVVLVIGEPRCADPLLGYGAAGAPTGSGLVYTPDGGMPRSRFLLTPCAYCAKAWWCEVGNPRHFLCGCPKRRVDYDRLWRAQRQATEHKFGRA